MNTVQEEKTAKKVTIAEVTEDEDMPDPLLFTDEAAAKVKSLIEEEDNDALMLRVFVSGGGCSEEERRRHGTEIQEVVWPSRLRRLATIQGIRSRNGVVVS